MIHWSSGPKEQLVQLGHKTGWSGKMDICTSIPHMLTNLYWDGVGLKDYVRNKYISITTKHSVQHVR